MFAFILYFSLYLHIFLTCVIIMPMYCFGTNDWHTVSFVCMLLFGVYYVNRFCIVHYMHCVFLHVLEFD